jgi:heterodisulfide reductase subunit B
MKFLRTCREVSALISTAGDRNLTLAERAAMHAHAFICRRCTSWKKQVSVMSKSMKAWKNYRD